MLGKVQIIEVGYFFEDGVTLLFKRRTKSQEAKRQNQSKQEKDKQETYGHGQNI
jgi:hypothetical protein